MTHYDVKYSKSTEKWKVIKHSTLNNTVKATAGTRDKAIKKAKGLATQRLVDQGLSGKQTLEIHVYGKDGTVKRVEKVEKP